MRENREKISSLPFESRQMFRKVSYFCALSKHHIRHTESLPALPSDVSVFKGIFVRFHAVFSDTSSECARVQCEKENNWTCYSLRKLIDYDWCERTCWMHREYRITLLFVEDANGCVRPCFPILRYREIPCVVSSRPHVMSLPSLFEW